MLDDTTIREFLGDDYPRLVNAVALLTGDLPAAEDTVQEALVRACLSLLSGGAPALACVAIPSGRALERAGIDDLPAGSRHQKIYPGPESCAQGDQGLGERRP